MMKNQLPLSLLRKLFCCDPEKGVLLWKVSRGGRVVGTSAGSLDGTGRRWVAVDGRGYAVHRIIYAMANGVNPPEAMEIDHIDRNPWNNAVDNLRLCSRSQNQANTRMYRRNTSGARGVSLVHRKGGDRWRALITKDGKKTHLGYFDSRERAASVWLRAAIKAHGEFTSTGTLQIGDAYRQCLRNGAVVIDGRTQDPAASARPDAGPADADRAAPADDRIAGRSRG